MNTKSFDLKKKKKSSLFLYIKLVYYRDGTPTDCSWGVLENYKKLGPDYLKKTDALRSKYHPIELDLTIPLGKVFTKKKICLNKM